MSKQHKETITRRQFIADTSLAAIGGTLLLGTPASLFSAASAPQKDRTKVVLIRDKGALDANGKPVDKVIREMLDKAVIELTGKSNALDSWKTIIKPSDIVGIKTNIWSPIGTTTQVEQALKARVMDVGVKETDISISDRGLLRNPVFKKATALINARPMRTHHWSGVGSLIKNYIMFVPDPYNYHDDSCANLAKIWKDQKLGERTRLNVLVMLTPQFHNVGPHGFSPRHVWNYYGLIVGFDPVAIDSVGVRIIQEKRKRHFKDDRPLTPPAKHILIADTKYHLGTADPKKIDLVKIGLAEDLLI